MFPSKKFPFFLLVAVSLTGLLSDNLACRPLHLATKLDSHYHKQLLGLLDNYSQQSPSVFTTYTSTSPTPAAHAIITIAGSFVGTDDALCRYAISIEVWQEELRVLKDLEDEIGNVIQVHEI